MAEQSISISFVTAEVAAGEALVVELDDDKNDDKTEFLYGETAHFRIYKYPSDMEVTITQSDGSISSEGGGTSEEEEDIIFTDTDESSCTKPAKSIISSNWLGNSLGSVSAEGTKISVSSKGVAVLRLKYKTEYTGRGLSLGGQGEDSYTVIVYVQGGEDED